MAASIALTTSLGLITSRGARLTLWTRQSAAGLLVIQPQHHRLLQGGAQHAETVAR
jgi:hypothetical protein